ncbi:hypothetical protein HZ326_22567 [Fusarium oxysporum f. sp. albedinis]|nr:hypothetical protein HZ326_22567 [Fusarium oxysporum f. sp. albedinis]
MLIVGRSPIFNQQIAGFSSSHRGLRPGTCCSRRWWGTNFSPGETDGPLFMRHPYQWAVVYLTTTRACPIPAVLSLRFKGFKGGVTLDVSAASALMYNTQSYLA